jgi:ABC-type iron transport system FetAB ATPase subunit
MARGEETVKERQSIGLVLARVYNLLILYFDPYYDTVLVIDKISSALSDNQKRDRIRACLDNYAREEDQLWCILKEAGVEDMWMKYKNIIGTRAGIKSAR